MRHSIEARKKILDAFFQRASEDSILDILKSDLARYGIVLICGFVERSVEIIILDRLSKKAHPKVLNFFKSFFRRGINYDASAICQLLVRFDVEWETNFKSFLASKPSLNENLNAAYTLRNSIAHGGSANRGLMGVKEIYIAAIEIIDGLIEATR